ncbi:uncharacterized protein LOC111064784 isoform X2 [Drosophila obscura]|uniref:uncharacterized protein LOC111064784 isoform X2 n=1 Tax=Drosophila obscura TaxID=7282 RepID=UPI001BB26250|nr:uncharacterized protein LOC111064784 isoform X2 [Drosophila obscura]
MFSILPLEILDKVLGYLDEDDQLNLGQVNQQLGRAFAYHARGKYRKISFSQFKTYGFEGNAMDVIFKLIAKHCVNLETASVNITPLTFNASKYVLAMKGLKTITLDFKIPDYEESDLIQYINPDCKVLSVENISVYQAENLRQLINLEELRVCEFYDSFQNIFHIVSDLKKLCVLCLRFCVQGCILIEENYYSDNQAENKEKFFECPELEVLKFDNCHILTPLPKCPKLKILNLFNSHFDPRWDFGDTIALYPSTLEHLMLFYSARSTFVNEPTEKHFLNILRVCKKLKCLSSSLDLIENILLDSLDFIAILKENGFNEERRFEINLYSFQSIRAMNIEAANYEVWNLITINNFLLDDLKY